MNHKEPRHIFNSAGVWIGFRLGDNVFDIDTVWRGWLPWDGCDDAVKPSGEYLGTMVNGRLYRFDYKLNIVVNRYPGYPAIPVLPNQPNPMEANELPPGASDVELKPAPVAPKAAPRQNRRKPH